ncbi:MAG: magnesium transporter [Chloroflexi bacterium]|nr:magnesium transporter [Chloroflexota bacterium]
MPEEQIKTLSQAEVLAQIRAALAARDVPPLAELAEEHPGIMAAALLALTPAETRHLVALIGDDRAATVVEELDAADAADVLARLTRADAADVLEEMAPDDATDVVEVLPPAEAEALLIEMEPADAAHIRELLAYPPDTAGGIMTPEFLALSPNLTVEEAITALRTVAQEVETVYYVYVIDAEDRLLGVLGLRNLLLAPPGTRVGDLVDRDVVRIRADADQEEAARMLREYRFLAIPVVDAENRLLGIITADDVADVVEEETTEDIERLGGSQPLEEPYLRASVLDLVRKRAGWLLFLFVASAYTVNVLHYFEAELQAVVALGFFIPMLIGTGGNVGSQVTTTLTRALALGDVAPGDVLEVLSKELRVSLLLGLVMGGATLLRALLLGTPDLGHVVAITAFLVVLWATTVAAVLPLLLRALRLDPAVVSTPLITTLVDGTGLVIYFEVARALLRLG